MSQSWASYRSITNVEELNEYVRHAPQPMQVFAALCNPPTGKALGLKKGDTCVYTYYPDMSDTGGELVENEPIPQGSVTPIRATYTLKEYGHAIPFTGLLEELSRLDPEDDFIVALINDMRKMENRLAFEQFDLTDWQVAFNSTADEFVTNGTLTSASDEQLTFANLRFVVRNAMDQNIPPFDGEQYVFVTGVTSMDALIFDNTVTTAVQQQAGSSALNGEVGSLAGCRLFRDNHQIDVVGGTSSGAGLLLDEGFLIGADAVQREIALAPELRGEDSDFGRQASVAHYQIGSWHKILDQTTHSREHIIKVSSAQS